MRDAYGISRNSKSEGEAWRTSRDVGGANPGEKTWLADRGENVHVHRVLCLADMAEKRATLIDVGFEIHSRFGIRPTVTTLEKFLSKGGRGGGGKERKDMTI